MAIDSINYAYLSNWILLGQRQQHLFQQDCTLTFLLLSLLYLPFFTSKVCVPLFTLHFTHLSFFFFQYLYSILYFQCLRPWGRSTNCTHLFTTTDSTNKFAFTAQRKCLCSSFPPPSLSLSFLLICPCVSTSPFCLCFLFSLFQSIN